MEGRLSEEFRLRTKKYAAHIIRFYVKLPRNRDEVKVIGRQLLRSGSSVAGHVREASRARSRAEFVSKLGGALQEADESSLWLELLLEECGVTDNEGKWLLNETGELIAIMTVMINRSRPK